MKYQINPSATLLSKPDGRGFIVRFLMDGSRKLHDFRVSHTGHRVLLRLYEQTTIAELTTKYRLTEREMADFLDPLVRLGLVIEERQFTDFARFGKRNVRTVEFFGSFGTPTNLPNDMMTSLTDASVLVLGLGGIGTWVVEMLARIGIGKLILVDDDRVEVSNIPRQAMFTSRHLNKLKVEVAKRYCRSVSRNTEVVTHSERINSSRKLAAKLNHVSLVINCADKPDVDRTNAIVSRACFEKHVPHILCGGYDGHLSFLGQTVIPYQTSCWFCYSDSGIYEKQLDGFRINNRPSGDVVGGTICPIGAQIATLQAQEAVRILTRCAPIAMKNRKAEVDFLNLRYHFTKIPKLKNCKLCSR